VAKRIPKTKEECEHYARYVWASSVVSGDALDVACGTGYGSRMLARRARISGVDRDEDAVSKARSRVPGTFLAAEVPPIPFPDNAFDFVVCFETVEHIRDDSAFIRDVTRLLRPSGRLLISTPNSAISAVDGVPINRWHVREYTLESLTSLLTEAGLEISNVYVQSFPPKITRGHRLAWRLHGLTWALPPHARAATRAWLGDSEVHPLAARSRAPGYWLASARPANAITRT
jgi:2-polyprenyl-3-methyl-5-hydroxy-6-metoxy-1,4-benzoquinol methylase